MLWFWFGLTWFSGWMAGTALMLVAIGLWAKEHYHAPPE